MNKMFIDFTGVWKVKINDESFEVKIPGTLDESGIGGKDELLLKKEGREFVKAEGPITSRFTRKTFYMGKAVYRTWVSREVAEQIGDRRAFFTVERSRALKLYVDGKEINALSGTLSTPYRFEITGLLKEGSIIELACDNSYPDMPAANILYSSAATDETQTNWNGLLGKVGIDVLPESFLSGIRIYTREGKAFGKVIISANRAFSGKIVLHSDVFTAPAEIPFSAEKNGDTTLSFEDIELKNDLQKWDEYEGNLYRVEARLIDDLGREVHSIESKFGVRDFGYDAEGRLTINGRRFFLRGEANCAEFPEEGHWPMDTETWLAIMEKYKAYGINCVRFHSHCPPEAAFEAADRLGIMVQPELSHWNPVDAFLPDHSYEYYKKELIEIITSCANHPSFVMLTLGNELHSSDEGIRRMEELLETARNLDGTRLYAWGSNNFYGEKGTHEKSDFYTSSNYFKEMLRAASAGMEGHINREYPGTCHNYSNICREIRKEYSKPIFGFEVGQYEVLPDFDEIEEFEGISDPVNYKIIRKRAEEKGEISDWKKYVEATGELALSCYKEEVEAVLRTPEMSGLSLLGIQDFPGQGTALVGMMNSHMEPKPYDFARPERFGSFFRPVLPLLYLTRHTYYCDEQISCDIRLANYGKCDINGKLAIEITEEESGRLLSLQSFKERQFIQGELSAPENFSIDLSAMGITADSGSCLRISLYLSEGEKRITENTYNIWTYPRLNPQKPDNVYETRCFDQKAEEVLKEGGVVFIAPDSDEKSLPHSIRAQYSTDFWSVGTFEFQEGGMGQLIDEAHPVFTKFPTKKYNQQQWWPMANQRAVILPGNIKSIIKEMDSYSYLRPLSKLFECRCLKGRVLFSSLGLHELTEYPEAKALLNCIYGYLESEDFCPQNEMKTDELRSLFV